MDECKKGVVIKKVALVTGGSKGIGLFVVLGLIKQGYKVVTCSRNIDTWKESCGKYPELKDVDYVQCDVMQKDDINMLFSHIKTNYGELHIALNNASPTIKCLGEFTQFSDEDIDFNLLSDLKSPILALQNQIKLMKEGSRVVNVTSISGFSPFKDIPIYTAAKYGMEGITKSLAVKYAPRGIRINSVAPGYTMSPRWEKRLEGEDDPESIMDEVKAKIPINRYAKPEEVAKAVLWLLSDDSSYVVGHTLVVDGGATLVN